MLYKAPARGSLLWMRRESRFHQELGRYCPQTIYSPISVGEDSKKLEDHIRENGDGAASLSLALYPSSFGHFSVADSSEESLWEMPASLPPRVEGMLELVAANSCQELRVTPLHCLTRKLIRHSVHGLRNKNNI